MARLTKCPHGEVKACLSFAAYRNGSTRLRFPHRGENLKRAALVLLPTASGSAQDPCDQFACCQFVRSQMDYFAGNKGYGDRVVIVCDMVTDLHTLLV